ncbi:hypothetical protein LIER_28638 [Lithospermum erythrorhizon]|uniref:Uncharacterized protein n=1 Tax=Lithospermum erythrorhizon TaxID=34254 RepID=A0AAV3RJP9_LITER
MGDRRGLQVFNDVLHREEKEGGHEGIESSMSTFWDFVSDIGAMDLGYVGYPFIWWNAKGGDGAIKCRLDLVLCSPQWGSTYNEANCFHLNIVGANHCPLLLDTHVSTRMVREGFCLIGGGSERWGVKRWLEGLGQKHSRDHVGTK